MPHNPYACPECSGNHVVECYACGQETDCEACKASGLDASRVDIDAFRAAAAVLQSEEGMTWAWVVNGEVCGRRNESRTLAYADFARKE